MQAVEFYKFFTILFALFFAYWSGREIRLFPKRINLQIYQDVQSLIAFELPFEQFQQQSNLQPKQDKWHSIFYLFFPLIALLVDNPIMALILIILCFLSLLDYYYYLTDIRYVSIIFALTLLEVNFKQDALFFTICFFTFIHFFSRICFKKEGFGLGDSLVLSTLSPLFDVQEMLLLILVATLFGILFYLGYWQVKKQKLEKLPFVPFITLSTFAVILAKI